MDIVPHETPAKWFLKKLLACSFPGCRSGSKAPARRALDHAPDGVEQVRGVDDQATECQTSQVVAHGHNLRRLDAMQPPLVRMQQLLDKLRNVPDQVVDALSPSRSRLHYRCSGQTRRTA